MKPMKILITGAKGFLGKNLTDRLLNDQQKQYVVYSYDMDSTYSDLVEYTKDCDFVFNFAAVHRPKNTSEFDKVNHVFFDDLLSLLEKHNNTCPVVYTSSIQATNGSDYGNSKLAAEADLKEYSENTGAKAIIYRLTNVYGRWATPNHHSVVATFCNNIAHGLPISISDREHVMNFYYIDDVIDSFMEQINGDCTPDEAGYYRLAKEKIHSITLGELADTLYRFEASLKKGNNITFKGETERTLFKTYISYRD